MLPGELIEELLGRCGATGLHILVALPDCSECFLIVLALPFQILGQGVVKGVSSALARRRANSSSWASLSGLTGSVSIESTVGFPRVDVKRTIRGGDSKRTELVQNDIDR